MVDSAADSILQIARRTPHEAAFRELVRRLDALPADALRARIDELGPLLAAWPAETRRIEVAPRSFVGGAARRLAQTVALRFVSAKSDLHVGSMLREMSSVAALELFPLDDDAAEWIAMAPASVRQVSMFFSPARRAAEESAARVASELARLEALDALSLSVGHATPYLVPAVLARPLSSFSTRIAELAEPSVFERLEPSSTRSLGLHWVDGIPDAWTPAAIARVLGRLPHLTDLTCPWVEPDALEKLSSLERLNVVASTRLEPSSVDRFFVSLPTTLRSLAVPGLSGDAILAALTRCPALEELSLVGSPLSPGGVRSLLDSGALERLTKMELNGAVEPKDARLLFERGSPRRLRDLNLFGLALGDATIQSLAKSSRWLTDLVSLDVQANDLSENGLAPLLDVLVEHADGLVALAVAGNRFGPDAYAKLGQLRERGVAIDVALPLAKAPTKTRAGEPAVIVAAAFERLHSWAERNEIPLRDFAAPASSAALEKAARLPPSLRASYAAHDGSEDTELLGLGRIVWWSLSEVLRAGHEERDGRELVVFAAPLDESNEPGRVPTLDDELDVVYAVAVDTEEVLTLHRKGSIAVAAQDLGAALEAIVGALENGTRTLDENGRILDAERDGPLVIASSRAGPTPATSAFHDFAAALVERHIIELRDGASIADLAAALAEAVSESTTKLRLRAVLAVFESPLVDEVFVDDDELRDVARHVARELA